MKTPPFIGSGTAIITPFDENGINFEKFGELIDIQIENKTDALIIAGTTGEASTMPDEEHLALFDYAVKRIGGRVPMIAGCGSNDTEHAVRFSIEAQKSGADAILSVTPYYNKANKSGLYEHFKKIARSVDIPIILYNIPSRTGVNIPIETLAQLNLEKNIVGIKEASGNISYMAQIAAEIPDICIYSGNDDLTLPTLALGGWGIISVAANILPEVMHNICRYFFDGDITKARNLQIYIMPLIKALFSEVNPVPVKTAMNMLGYEVGSTRLPLGIMQNKNHKELYDTLKKYFDL